MLQRPARRGNAAYSTRKAQEGQDHVNARATREDLRLQ